MKNKFRAISTKEIREILPKRNPRTQKWDYGHCLVAAGSRQLFGAALLSTRAALKGGAGLVTAAIGKSLQPLVYSQTFSALTLALEETVEGTISDQSLETILTYIAHRKVTSAVLGPGLTRNASTARFVQGFIDKTNIPLVLDADAINITPRLKKDGVFYCLTPHQREWARFLGVNEREVIKNGLVLAQKFVNENPNCIIVLKGPATKVVASSGIWENPTGNPGMAKGGSGDVLSGLMGSFLAQKKTFPDYTRAVLSAVYLHGLAGDLAAKDLTEYATQAEDLISYLPQAFKKVGLR